ncbi:unnamed protein product [Effrenium voratum]|uniref:Uncharacterized protein n=1 Tax=Effrenium voratum TaxID=2562239 RepID=A0AA36IUG9_9DINO|nr:unnamed protein product [Effrenium voratum]
MSFGKAQPRQNHALLPRRDRSLEVSHSKAPAVPRAPRPKEKPQSAGALARDTWSRKPSNESGHLTMPSEARRPRSESPFARINQLKRERECTENQAIEVGPPRRAESTVTDNNFHRGHILGQEITSFKGIHWSKVSNFEANERPLVRKSLLREMQEAPQELEWLKAKPKPNLPEEKDFSRRNVLAREAADDEDRHLDQHGQGQNGYHGRINVLRREVAKDGDTTNMPRPAGVEASGAPIFVRPRTLVKVSGIGS